MQINLSKEQTRNTVDIVLSKQGWSDSVCAKVNIVLDGSHSMRLLYANGTVQALVDRILAVGYKFDDDGSIDVFDFSDGNNHRQLEAATQDDHGSYMNGKSMIGGGTAYSPVLKRVEDFYYKEGKKKFFGLFGKEQAAEGRDGKDDKHPVFTVFITDGESLQPEVDKKEISKILSKRKDMFVQFVGVGNANFSFLRNLDNSFDNAGFVKVNNLSNTSDEDLLKGVLSEKAKKVVDVK